MKGFVCPSCQQAESVAESSVIVQCRYYGSCLTTATQGDAVRTEKDADGWCRWRFQGVRWWVCPHCQHASNSDLEVPIPPNAEEPEPGHGVDSENVFVVCCATCSYLTCFLHSCAPKNKGWRHRKDQFICPACWETPQEVRIPPKPFPTGCDSCVLAQRVVELTLGLNSCLTLPDWVHDASDATLRAAGSCYPPKDSNDVDAGNAGGSVLMLAMLLPDIFGVPGAPALRIFGSPPPATVVQISSHRSRSSVGADNRRTNAVEGLMNHWQGLDEPLRVVLQNTWILMGRAVAVVDPFNKLLVKDFARNCFAVSDLVEDDGWWDWLDEEREDANEQAYRYSLFCRHCRAGQTCNLDSDGDDELELKMPYLGHDEDERIRTAWWERKPEAISSESEGEEDEGVKEKKDEGVKEKKDEYYRKFIKQAQKEWYKMHVPLATTDYLDAFGHCENESPNALAAVPTPARAAL